MMQVELNVYNRDMQLRLHGDNWTALTHPFARSPENAAILMFAYASDGQEGEVPAEIRGGTLYHPSKEAFDVDSDRQG